MLPHGFSSNRVSQGFSGSYISIDCTLLRREKLINQKCMPHSLEFVLVSVFKMTVPATGRKGYQSLASRSVVQCWLDMHKPRPASVPRTMQTGVVHTSHRSSLPFQEIQTKECEHFPTSGSA